MGYEMILSKGQRKVPYLPMAIPKEWYSDCEDCHSGGKIYTLQRDGKVIVIEPNCNKVKENKGCWRKW